MEQTTGKSVELKECQTVAAKLVHFNQDRSWQSPRCNVYRENTAPLFCLVDLDMKRTKFGKVLYSI